MYFDYSEIKENKAFYHTVKPVIKLLSHVVYSSRCVGRENIPLNGKLIFACNHIGTPDPAFIVANSPRRIHFMAKSELFQRKDLASLFTHMNAFPVMRCTADRKALRYAIELLKLDRAVGIFPEGRRVRNHESVSPLDALSGVGYLAKISGADVLPCCLYRNPDSGKFRPKVVVIFGKVIKNENLGFIGENRSAETRQAAQLIMDEIKELWYNADREFGNGDYYEN